jgi:hypothetical protein
MVRWRQQVVDHLERWVYAHLGALQEQVDDRVFGFLNLHAALEVAEAKERVEQWETVAHDDRDAAGLVRVVHVADDQVLAGFGQAKSGANVTHFLCVYLVTISQRSLAFDKS